MTVYFNHARGRWVYSFQFRNQRYSGYAVAADGTPCASRGAAMRAERRARTTAEAAAGRDRPPAAGAYSLAEAIADWGRNIGQHRRSWPEIRTYLRELREWFGGARPIVEIDADLVDAYIAWARGKRVAIYLGGPRKGGAHKELARRRSDSTINRYLIYLGAVLKRADERRRVDDPAWRAPKLPRLEEPKDLPTPIPDDALAAIIDCAPPHLVAVIVLCIHTGMRESECLGLTWDRVRLDERVITLDSRTKGKRGRAIYINEIAYQTLRRLADEAPDSHVTQASAVVLYKRGKNHEPAPVASIAGAWRGALKRAGFEGRWRFHDTRASFATYLASRGADGPHLQSLLDHRDPTTSQRYIKAAAVRERDLVKLLEQREATANLYVISHKQNSHTRKRNPS